MGAGLPVVASSVDGLRDIVADGVSGHLVAPGDPAELAAVLDRLSGDADHRREAGRRGRERVEELFGLDRMVDGTLAVYRDAVRSR